MLMREDWEEMMFQKGDLIVYANSGVCRVEDVAPLAGARGADAERLYYRLSPVYGAETIFVPVDTAAFMRPILTPEKVNGLIDLLPGMEPCAYTERSTAMLSSRYHAAFESHRSEDLMQLMKDVYQKGQAAQQRGRPLGMVDQRYQKKAEELIYGEFSVVLGIPLGDVEAYISRRIAGKEGQRNIS